MNKPSTRTHFTLGLVGPVFGLKGFVKVKPFSGETAHFSRLSTVTLRKDGKDETKELAEIITQGDTLLVRFQGVESPEAAALFKSAEVIAEREFAAPLAEGEFYIEDLKGLEVVDKSAASLGHIIEIVEGGGGFLAEILLASGAKKFAPFRNEFFGDISFELGKVELLDPSVLD